jgi:hypothetical protein
LSTNTIITLVKHILNQKINLVTLHYVYIHNLLNTQFNSNQLENMDFMMEIFFGLGVFFKLQDTFNFKRVTNEHLALGFHTWKTTTNMGHWDLASLLLLPNHNPVLITYVLFILEHNLLSKMFNLVSSCTWQAIFFGYHWPTHL